MAAPQYGTLALKGRSGRYYNVSIYANDVTANPVRFDAGNGVTTTSPTFWKCPEDVKIVDLSVVTGLTDCSQLYFTANGAKLPDSHILHVPHVTTYTARPPLDMYLPAGAELGAIQQT